MGKKRHVVCERTWDGRRMMVVLVALGGSEVRNKNMDKEAAGCQECASYS